MEKKEYKELEKQILKISELLHNPNLNEEAINKIIIELGRLRLKAFTMIPFYDI